ncbi:MAG: hypothetical protein ACE5JK_08235, partial [Candidatus Omnitrophota bacterium]
SKKELLRPTVISRCTEVRFNSLSAEVAKSIIMSRSDVDEEGASFLADFTEGSPGRALEVINEGVLERKEDIIGMLEEITGEKDAIGPAWDNEGKASLLEDLELLIMFFRDIALEKEEMRRFSKQYSIEKISDIIERLIGLKQALMGNVNPKLVAQVLPGVLK